MLIGESSRIKCHALLKRVRRLERKVILQAILSAFSKSKESDAGITCFVADSSLRQTSTWVLNEFKTGRFKKFQKFLECHLIAGDFEYLL